MIIGMTSNLPMTPLQGTISTEGSLTGTVSVSVRDVPYYETDNPYGGTTVYIGKEVVNNGI